ncbi:IS630 family transposase [Piscirickettsia salmonis]|uniref:IS630 family transposase n=1 Tax=Piscirickettsia salmonis TaxID=1238 RepID=UPI0012BA31C9|nr:IS630 family transposase [Piscirickettsia salmonis]
MPSPYSYDLRIRALKMIDEGIPITQISKLLKISRDTLHRWKNRRDHTGDVKARFGYQTGYNHKISDMEEFQKFIDQNPGKTHQQLADLYPVEMSAKTMGVWIKKLAIPEKKSFRYQERDALKRKAFLEKVEKIDNDKIVYMDEAGMDDTERYAYGHSAKGKRCYAEKPGKKSIRINFIGGLRGKQFMAPMMVEGYCNANVCQAYIDQCLIPCLSPGETVIMDNASFHKSKGVKEAIEDAGCHLLFLPPYSPDLNPIEHVWSPLKNRVRMKLDQDEINLETALSQVMKSMSETIR